MSRQTTDAIDFNETDESTGYTVLTQAVVAYDSKTLHTAMFAHADMNVCDAHNRTPFQTAVEFGRTETAIELMAFGVDIGSTNLSIGDAPIIHKLVRRRLYLLVQKCIDAGWDVNERDAANLTPLNYAIDLNAGERFSDDNLPRAETICSLVRHGAIAGRAFQMEYWPLVPIDVARMLVSMGYSIFASGFVGSLLYVAMQAYNIDLIEYALSLGATFHAGLISRTGIELFHENLIELLTVAGAYGECASDIPVADLLERRHQSRQMRGFSDDWAEIRYIVSAMGWVRRAQTQFPQAYEDDKKAGEKIIGDGRARLYKMHAFPIATALQSLALPAPLTIEIIDEAVPIAQLVSFHMKWDVVTRIKHFLDKREPD